MKSVLTYKPGALFEHLLPPSLRPLDQEDDESDDEVDDAPPPPQNKGKGKAKDTGASRAGTGRKQAADAKKPAKANKGKKKALQADLTSDDDDALAEGCAIAAVGLGSRLIDATGVFGRKNESRAASTFLVVPGAGSILWVIGVGGGGVRGDVGIS